MRVRTARWSPCVGALVLSVLGACAVDQPGIPPPRRQLYFPVGIDLVPGPATSDDVLVVANSDFDQRYNAATVLSLSVDALLAGTASAARVQTEGGTSPAVAFVDDVSPSVKSELRILPFAGHLRYIPDPPPAATSSSSTSTSGGRGSGQGLVAIPTRGNNALTLLGIKDGAFDCSSGGGAPVAGTDCTNGYVFGTGSLDPYDVAYDPDNGGTLAIAHLRPYTDPSANVFLDVPLVSIPDFKSRLAAKDWSRQIVRGHLFPNVDGATGVVFARYPGLPDAAKPNGSFFVSQRFPDANSLVTLAAFDVHYGTGQDGGPALTPGDTALIGNITQAGEIRGLALTPPGERRAYLVARYQTLVNGTLTTTMYTSAIIVVDVEEGRVLSNQMPMTVLTTFPVGQELEKPYLYEPGDGRRLLYVPDIRLDEIFVIDVRGDQPVVVNEIRGRFPRVVNGRMIAAHTLDAPVSMTFVRRPPKTYAFVSNFANSTIAVLDISAFDPAEHRLIGRIGTALNPDGSVEGSR